MLFAAEGEIQSVNRSIPFFWILLLLVFVLMSPAAAQQLSATEDQFSSEEIDSFNSGPDFEIVSGAIRLNPAFGFADGTYKLVNAQIVAVAPTSYQVVLNFVKRKGVLNYRHQEKLALLYDGSRLWFKRQGQVYRFRSPVRMDRRHSETLQQPKQRKNLLNVELDGLKLQLDFH